MLSDSFHQSSIVLAALCVHLALLAILPQLLSVPQCGATLAIADKYYRPSITLHSPRVNFGGYGGEFVSRASLLRPIEYPADHEPAIIGEGTKGVFVPGAAQNSANIITLNNVYFTAENVYIENGNYTLFTHECHPKYWDQFYTKPATVEYSDVRMYERAVCVGHQHSSDFGHWFLEVLPAIAALPPEVLNGSYIFVPDEHEYIYKHLAMLGVPRERVIADGGDKLFFAKTFYTVEFNFCGNLVPYLVNNLRRRFVQEYGLDKVEPDMFLVFNRKGMSREIGNMEEVMKMLKERFPKINWQEAVLPETLEEQARYFNRVKLIFSIHGSIFANGLFMQNNTAIVDMQMEQWLLSFLYLARQTGKYMVAGRDPRISWRGMTPNVLDLDYVATLIETALNKMNVVYK